MPRYKITFQHPDDNEPDTDIIYAYNIELSFTELQRDNPKVEFISYEEIEEEEEVDFVVEAHREDLGLPDPAPVDPNSLDDAEYEEWQKEQAEAWKDV
ncbi:MAG: hypothetical protein V7K72_25860 [Nostoc sp.]|uniref:hypothetical protein n=1 Tax=Nostoc sp. TaxID=1180 RepID=UPI002FF6AA5B